MRLSFAAFHSTLSTNGSSRFIVFSTILALAFLDRRAFGLGVVSRVSRQSAPRWAQPCGGGQPADVSRRSTRQSSEPLPQLILDHFATIKIKALETKQRIVQLEQVFTDERFNGDESFIDVNDLNNLQWIGLPSTTITVLELQDDNIMHLVNNAFLQLAIFAVHMEQTRLDEATYEGSRFLLQYQELEEQGLYWLLCQLQILTRDLNEDLTEDIADVVKGIKILEVNSRAVRHIRDYILLRQLRELMYKLVVQFTT